MKKIVALASVATLVACQTVTKPGVAIGPRGPVEPEQYLLGRLPVPGAFDSNGNRVSPYKSFNDAYSDSAGSNWNDQSKAELMMLAGFSFSMSLCDRYFNILANNNQDLGFGTEAMAIGSGFVSSVLGLTESPAKSISLVATGFSATIAGMESFQQHYYFGPDVSTVREMVAGGMENYRANILSSDLSDLNHYTAINHIQRMQSICQVDRIKSYVDQAVANQQITFSTAAREDFFGLVSLDFTAQVSQLLGASQTLSPRDMTYIFMLNTGNTSAELNSVIRPRLESIGLGSLIVQADGSYSPPANAAAINRLIMSLPAESRRLLQARANNVKSSFEEMKARDGTPPTEEELPSGTAFETLELKETITPKL